MPNSQRPFFTMLAAAMLGLFAAVAALVLAVNQPWLGIELVKSPDGRAVTIHSVSPHGAARDVPPGLVLGSVGDVAILPEDLIEEPDVAETYVAMGLFFDRQSALRAALSAPVVLLRAEDGPEGGFPVRPEPLRDITDLPAVFWVQIAVGLVSLMVGAWVWSFRRGQLPAQLLAVAALGLPLSAFPAAVYSSREIALNGEIFHALSAMNHFGTLTFGVAMTALFLVYPVRLVRPRLLWVLPAVYAAFWIMDTTWTVLPSPIWAHHLPAVVLMAAILTGAALQYRATWRDPAARAAIRWFALAVCLCAGTFIVIVVMPNLFGIRPAVSQGYAFVLFALMFLGVAAGVARYRLFELESWTLPILTYFGGVALLILLDAALIFLVSMDRPAAFAISLVIVAVLYLPIRDRVMRWLLPASRIDRAALFSRIVDVAFSDPEGQDRQWRQVLQDSFLPLRILPDAGPPASVPSIAEDGLTLRIPALPGLPALLLSHARGGRSLFSIADRGLAEEIWGMMNHAIASRNAYEKGVDEERLRIARDMHDSLGAQLLSALYSPSADRKDTLIRETIVDLRDIVNNASSGGRRIDELLADLKIEALQRLGEAGIALDWAHEFEDENVILATNVTHALRSVLRELVSNVIRHSGARTLRMRFATKGGVAELELADDGRGPGGGLSKRGNGLSNIETRLLALRGTLALSDAEPGLAVRARFPLAGADVA